MPDHVLEVLIGFVIGGLGAWLVSRSKGMLAQVRLAERDRELATSRSECEALRVALAAAQQERERALATLEAQRSAAQERIATLEEMEGRLRDAFGALSAQALQANTEAFAHLANARLAELQESAKADLTARQESIDQLVRPVQEGLAVVDARLQAFDRDRAATAAAVQEHLRLVAEAQQHLAGETQALVTALRAPQARGQWGELQLRRVVELAGMVEHCDFVEQHTIQTDDGRLRPDLVVRLPGRKAVVVDSKAPLVAYLDAIQATDERERGLHLDRHAKQVRDHVEALAKRDYADHVAEAPDFVVLFLPGEAFFSAACQRDACLLELSLNRGVIIASPITLITVLKSVAYGWQQDRIAENAEQIRDLGQELYEHMRTLAGHLADIRQGLEAAVMAFNKATGSIDKRVLPTARKFRDLGAGMGEEIPTLDRIDTGLRLPVAAELVVEAEPVLARPALPAATIEEESWSPKG
jgi:DNA recombination protein RmuC